MSLETVAILSPGDMGHAVGKLLKSNGLRVITCLQNRSERTRQLAQQAQIENVVSYRALVEEADILLSIMVPAQAAAAARLVSVAVAQVGSDLVYADCNAISPQTTQYIGHKVSEAGGRFVDASIIGGPPRAPGTTRFYASGPHVTLFEELGAFGLNVVNLGPAVGLASSIKMCYAALTKGLAALSTELLVASYLLGVSDGLLREFQNSQPQLLERMERGLPNMPAKSRRWVGEMEEISKTFAGVGLTPAMLSGAADMYRLVGDTELADRNPEDTDPPPPLEEMIAALAAKLV
jgi:3-hydroxyisobutyrate dehydrogenase-like beta-hydroxyacid dehydrogenase